MSGNRITTMEQNGGPPEAAAMLYPGEVMHARLNPFGHRFAYSVFSLLIDIDRLQEADRQSRFFSVNRRNLAAFCESDHVGVSGESIRHYVDRILTEADVPTAGTKVLLLCFGEKAINRGTNAFA